MEFVLLNSANKDVLMLAPRSLLAAIFFVMVLVVSPSTSDAGAILNTLQGYDVDEPGWSGGLDGLFSGSGGNTDRIFFSLGGRTQWRGERNRYRIQFSSDYEESSGVETARSGVFHMRHNYQISDKWLSVAFAQVQHNPFQELKSRWLVGLGPRFEPVNNDHGVVAFGAVPMLEVERLESRPGHLARGRMSFFVHLSRQLSETTQLDLVGFWQPLFSDFSAIRAVGNLVLKVDVTGEVDLKVGFSVEDNSRPPVGVERTDWGTFVGLSLNL
ncbi:MAG: putative salt-induced outer membrane protein YdiY [Candidatus Krumholzibacteriia bacterium]|jgi:putative salt-induced outer membrane protein YdiY